ncbi:ATP synthase F0 subcomplex subunit OSCP atp5 [Rhizina undulata]
MFTARSVALARTIVPRGIRTYAVAASPKPPVQLFGVDGTYASALYTAAAKTSTLESTDKALQNIKNLLKKDAKLNTILASPTLNAADKSAIVYEISKATGQDKTVKNLLEVLAENNRLGVLSGVIEQYATLMSAHRGEVEAVVTSASPLDSKILSRLEAVISKSQYVQPGQKLKVTNKVNPEIIGALVVEVGDRTVDASVASKLAKLNKLLTEPL